MLPTVGLVNICRKQTRSRRKRRIHSISNSGTHTQKLPHASVVVSAITWVSHRKGKNHTQGFLSGNSPSKEQVVSSAYTVAKGTGSSAPVDGSFLTTWPQMRRNKSRLGSICQRNFVPI